MLDRKSLLKLGLNERQLKAVEVVMEYGKINNSKYREINGIARNTASRDLQELVAAKIFGKIGKKGAGSEYILIAP